MEKNICLEIYADYNDDDIISEVTYFNNLEDAKIVKTFFNKLKESEIRLDDYYAEDIIWLMDQNEFKFFKEYFSIDELYEDEFIDSLFMEFLPYHDNWIHTITEIELTIRQNI